MINTRTVSWLEKSLRLLVVAVFLVFALMTMTGILRWLTSGVLAAAIVYFLMKKGCVEADEREVYLNYIANTMAFMTTWATIGAISTYQYIQYGRISRGIIVLLILAGVSQGFFQALVRRAA